MTKDNLRDSALELGKRMAKVLFDKRSAKGMRNRYASLTEVEVMTLCAAAYEFGYEESEKAAVDRSKERLARSR